MPYNSGTGAYERRSTTVIDATPDGDTVAVAIDVKLDAGIDDYVTDLNHHKTNGNHYPAPTTADDSRYLGQSPAGVVSWKDGVPAADAALKSMANVTSTALESVMVGNISTHAHNATGAYNHIINGDFDIWQRATSQTTSGYGSADRWANLNVGSTKTTSLQAFAVGSAFPDGEICPPFYSRTVVTSVAGAGNFVRQQQRIEFVKTLAGKKATLSFYAKADASKNIAVELSQNFGTTGSPSSEVTAIGAQKIALTTAWQRLTVVFDVPSISGKTLGSAANDYLALTFWLDAGSSFNARTDSLGGQSGTFDIACVSLVEGDVDVKPIPRSYGEELALCERYYATGRAYTRSFASAADHFFETPVYFPTRMRTIPVTTLADGGGRGNAKNIVLSATPTTDSTRHTITSIGVGNCMAIADIWTADAEL